MSIARSPVIVAMRIIVGRSQSGQSGRSGSPNMAQLLHERSEEHQPSSVCSQLTAFSSR
jgi:hypothetical protein